MAAVLITAILALVLFIIAGDISSDRLIFPQSLCVGEESRCNNRHHSKESKERL